MWIKTRNIVNLGYPNNNLFVTLPEEVGHTWYLGPGYMKNQMNFQKAGNKVESTLWNDTVDVSGWRHVAVAVRSESQTPEFYLEGYKMKVLRNTGESTTEFKKPDTPSTHLRLWRDAKGKKEFDGAMACVTFFAEILSDSEIRNLREACP